MILFVCFVVQDEEYERDDCENVFHNPICNASLAFTDGQEARMVTSQDARCALLKSFR